MMKTFNFLFIYLALVFPLMAQNENTQNNEGYELVNLEDAINRALELNHHVRISRFNAEISDRNVYLGNAGFLPQVFVEAGIRPAIQAVQMEFFDNEVPPIDMTGALSNLINGAAGINYTLFQGLAKNYTIQRLRGERGAANALSRFEIENTLLNVINNYLEVAQLEQDFIINQRILDISMQRFERAKVAYEFGGQTRWEVLNAEVDLNTDSINLLRTELNLNNSKRNLKVLMGEFPKVNFTVSTNVHLNTGLELGDFLEKALARNSRIEEALYNNVISGLDVRLRKSEMFPRIDLNIEYTLNRQYNEAGFFRFQDIRSFTGGLNFRYIAFDARRRSVNKQIAQINEKSSLEYLEQVRKEIERDVLNAFANYKNNLYLLRFEQRNQETVNLNFERVSEAFSLGQANTSQYREAQLNLAQAELRLVQLQYQVKLSEIELYRLSGTLIPSFQE